MEYFFGPTRTLSLGEKNMWLYDSRWLLYIHFVSQAMKNWSTGYMHVSISFRTKWNLSCFINLSFMAGLLLFFNSYNTSHFPAEDSLDDRGGAGWRRQGQSHQLFNFNLNN